MFCLKLHSAHEYEPEEVRFLIVPARDYLVVDEWVFDLLVIAVFSFMIADEDECRIKACDQVSDEEIRQVLIVVEQDHVVDWDGSHLDLSYGNMYVVEAPDGTDHWVESPFQVKELI